LGSFEEYLISKSNSSDVVSSMGRGNLPGLETLGSPTLCEEESRRRGGGIGYDALDTGIAQQWRSCLCGNFFVPINDTRIV